MKFIKEFLSISIVLFVTFYLNQKHGNTPAIGKFLDPFHGFLALVGSDIHQEKEIKIPQVKDNVKIIIDKNHVPHIFAENEYDLFFAQGYFTAFDRLWQMEFQTYAAAGRISEIIGSKALSYDQYQRRIVIYACENKF